MTVLHCLTEFPKSGNKSIRNTQRAWHTYADAIKRKNIYSNAPKNHLVLSVWKIVNPKDISVGFHHSNSDLLWFCSLRRLLAASSVEHVLPGGKNIGSIRAGTKDWKCLGRLGKPRYIISEGKGSVSFKFQVEKKNDAKQMVCHESLCISNWSLWLLQRRRCRKPAIQQLHGSIESFLTPLALWIWDQDFAGIPHLWWVNLNPLKMD